MALNPANYCQRCASVLDHTQAQKVVCRKCDWSKNVDEDSSLTDVLTVVPIGGGHTNLKAWQLESAFKASANLAHAEIEIECPECQNPILWWWTKQTRSADEGSTCYYQCPKCDYKKSENN